MSTGAFLTYPRFKAFDANGLPLAGGLLYTYAAGTVNTPKAAYSDAACTVPLSNPVVLDNNGEADIFLNGLYKLVLTDANGVTVPMPATDNIGSSSGLISIVPSGGVTDAIAAAGGTADAITATYNPAIALNDMVLCAVRFKYANATTTPTFAPNGLTAHTIVKNGGIALRAGDISGANHVGLLQYDLTNTRWELLNPVSPLFTIINTVTGSRAFGIVYQNLTGYPMKVSIIGSSNVPYILYLNVGPTSTPGLTPSETTQPSNVGTYPDTVSAIVPPNYYYKCTYNGGPPDIAAWYETY